MSVIHQAILSAYGPHGPQMPSGAIGLWYVDAYAASPRRLIPNSVASAPVSQSLLNAGRRMFSNTEFWASQGVTATDANAMALDETMSASTLACIGSWAIGSGALSTVLPAGTYTVCCNVKSASGSNEVFAFSKDNTGTRSAVQTATTIWGRFSYTFTIASGTTINRVLMCSSDGSTNASLQVCDFELFAGSVDLGPVALAGHMYLNLTTYDSLPAYASGELGLASGGFGLVQFPSAVTLTNASTACALVKQMSAGVYSAFLSKVQSYENFSAYASKSDAPELMFGGTTYSEFPQSSGLWRLTGAGYHVLTHRRTATHIELWVDDCCVLRSTASPSAVAVQDLFVGAVNTISLTASFNMSAICLWGRTLTNEELLRTVALLQARAGTSGITATNVQRIYCAEGDSITAAAGSYAYLSGPNLTPAAIGTNYALSGSQISHLASRATYVDAMLPADKTGRTFVLSILIGANDLGALMTNAQIDTWLSSVAAYCDARRASGWKVVIGTILPSASADRNTNRDYANPLLRAFVGVHADGLMDFAANATVGGDAAGSNTTYYPDGLHPSATTQTILEAISRAAINAL